MEANKESLDEIRHIKNMMERSTRFKSLSGYSGIGAGICGLILAWFASDQIECLRTCNCNFTSISKDDTSQIQNKIITASIITFIAAFVISFYFIYERSKKSGVSIWGGSSMRLMRNMAIPMAAGGFVLLRFIQINNFEFIIPFSLLFYGLSLINAGKYTHVEAIYLGFGELFLGIWSLWLPEYGLYFWAVGFGILHLIFGFVLWARFDRKLA